LQGFFFYLTPFVPLSFKGEGEIIFLKGLASLLIPPPNSHRKGNFIKRGANIFEGFRNLLLTVLQSYAIIYTRGHGLNNDYETVATKRKSELQSHKKSIKTCQSIFLYKVRAKSIIQGYKKGFSSCKGKLLSEKK
jgi:hypothetical protein